MDETPSLKRQRDSDDETDAPREKQPNLTTEQEEIVKPSKSARRRAKQKEAKLLALQVTCSLPPLCDESPQVFANSGLYEAHYRTCHVNICSECKKNFPTSKILECHLTENHDPFSRIKLEKGEPIFHCFVTDCDRMFKDHKKRRLHLIDKHHYPKDYIFSVVDSGIKNGDVSLIKANNKSYNVWKPAN